MDSFSLLSGVVVILLAFSFGQTWIVILTIALMIVSMRSIGTTIALIGVSGSLYFFNTGKGVNEIALITIAGIVAVALLSEYIFKQKEPEMPGFGGLEGLDLSQYGI